ncbi:hypothetical protein J2S30_000913 [Herbaspirillum rubrisubalbicans]|nr:hypothetical protein [Herbaspirillum rubrisubalbicans]
MLVPQRYGDYEKTKMTFQMTISQALYALRAYLFPSQKGALRIFKYNFTARLSQELVHGRVLFG